MQLCANPACHNGPSGRPALVATGRCAACKRGVEQSRRTSRERGYSRRWEAAARAFRAQYPLCGMRPGGLSPVMSQCHDQGRVSPAEQVDHVVPHRGDQALFWDREGNWQSLCRACGARKSQAGL